jgi:hypothetical protein
MLNNTPVTMVKDIKIEILSQNVCIQYFGNVKVTFSILNFSFISFFSMLNKCPEGTV